MLRPSHLITLAKYHSSNYSFSIKHFLKPELDLAPASLTQPCLPAFSPWLCRVPSSPQPSMDSWKAAQPCLLCPSDRVSFAAGPQGTSFPDLHALIITLSIILLLVGGQDRGRWGTRMLKLSSLN